MKKIPEHGGNYNFFNKEIRYDFSINVNPLRFPEKLKDKLLEKIDDIEKYPEIYSESFIKKVSEFYNCSENNFIAGNGSIQLIYLIPSALKLKEAVVVVPNFSEYEKSLKLYNINLNFFYLKENEEFALDVDKFMKIYRKKSIDAIFITNPSNPCANLIEYEKLLKIAEYCRKNNIFLIIDEAFIDFTEAKSLIFKNFKGLIIIRSFTKNFAIAGLRLGIIKSDKNTVQTLKRFLPPWSVNSLSIEAGKILIENYDFLLKTRSYVKKEREYLKKELLKIKNLKIFHSDVNYFLIKILNNLSAFQLTNILLDRGILIRDCSNFRGLNEKFFRICVKNREENKVLIESLKEIFIN